MASSGKGGENDPATIRGLLSQTPIAEILMFMPSRVSSVAMQLENDLQAISDALRDAEIPPSLADVERFKLALGAFASSQKAIKDELAHLFQCPSEYSADTNSRDNSRT